MLTVASADDIQQKQQIKLTLLGLPPKTLITLALNLSTSGKAISCVAIILLVVIVIEVGR